MHICYIWSPIRIYIKTTPAPAPPPSQITESTSDQYFVSVSSLREYIRGRFRLLHHPQPSQWVPPRRELYVAHNRWSRTVDPPHFHVVLSRAASLLPLRSRLRLQQLQRHKRLWQVRGHAAFYLRHKLSHTVHRSIYDKILQLVNNTSI